MFHEGHLLLILHEVPEPGRPERHGLLFWRDPAGNWRSTQGAGLHRVAAVVDHYVARLDALEARFESARDATALFEVLRHGSPLRRATTNLRRALQQAREAVGGRELIALRDQADELVLASELLLTDSKNALDYTMARQAEEQSRVDRAMAANGERLNRLAAIFLPLTLLASLFGMNLPSGLERTGPHLFWAIIGGGLLLGFVMGRFATSRRQTPPVDRDSQAAHKAAPRALEVSSGG
jgi:Mg2+ and Co2+ transporter CorA